MEENKGFTVAELIVTIIIFAIISMSVAVTLFAYIGASSDSRLRTTALAVATEQMERLRSLPYDNLAIAGGSIAGSGVLLPATEEKARGGRVFTVQTDIRYIDDAFDGCLNYGASQAIYCKHYKSTTVLSDTNPRDYKVATVVVTSKGGSVSLATLSTHFTSRIAETAGNSAAVLARVLDSSGTPVAGAQIRVRNTVLSPNVDQTATTDVNGEALFLDIPPDAAKNYIVMTSKNGYSSLSTMAQSGSLVPKYANINAIAQKVSNVTLVSDIVSDESIEIRTVDIDGNPVPNARISLRGGVKLYTDPDDATYSQELSVTSDAAGIAQVGGLTPGTYEVCYLAQPRPCAAASLSRALTVWVAYGAKSTQPFTVQSGKTGPDGGPMQRIVVTLSDSGLAPRITNISPNVVAASGLDASATEITVAGANLSGAAVHIETPSQPAIAGTVSGADSTATIRRVFNVTGMPQGAYDVVIATPAGTVRQKGIAPGTVGGVNVTP